MIPGSIDDLIAQRIDRYQELMSMENNPLKVEKMNKAINALVNAPRQTEKLKTKLLQKKADYDITLFTAYSGMAPPILAEDLLIEIQEYEWLLSQLRI